MEPEPIEDFAAPEELSFSAGNTLLDGIEGVLKRPPLSFWYRLTMVMVAMAMILLPLIYAVVVGVFGWAVFYYATHCYTMLGAGGSVHFTFFLFILYVGPLVAGCILAFFLVKPIFAPRHEPEESFPLNHADAPQLFALIGWICRTVDAPIPSRVDVNSAPNASAGFRAGFRSILGNDIVLTIGLPLVAGMNLSQFAGIIAHEYGHFSQGMGMRAMYVISRINQWLYRVVYERDAWDYWLVESSEDPNVDWRILMMLVLARTGVWVGRRILWVLMVVGNLLSSFLSRQMEFDADHFEFQMSGSGEFAATARRLRQLNIGMELAAREASKLWKKEKKLFDQFPEMIVRRADGISAESQGQLYAKMARRKTGLFDSHPSDAERIRRAEAANEPGILRSTAPATSLFTDFGELSRRLTLHYYESWLGPKFSTEALISVEQTTRRAEHDAAVDRENVQRYLFGVSTSLRPIIISENKALVFRSSEALTISIRSARAGMQQLLPAAQTALEQFRQADEDLLTTSRANHLLQAGFPFNPADLGLADFDTAPMQADAWQRLQTAEATLKQFEESARTRLADAIQLLRLPQVITPLPEAPQLREEARNMIWVLSRLDDVFPVLLELRRDCAALEALLRYRGEGHAADNLAFTFENLGIAMQERINQIQEKTSQIRYPFHHGDGEVFVSTHARNKEYHSDPMELALREGTSPVEKLIALYYRLLSRLVSIAEEVEQRLAI